ncbi:P-loop NTPase family protein [Aetokthonos hydrillicola Thurmond2011]|jgi:cob(I)alamin adenosyltransferase|uniref:P-loop NTPase family protein n=1 Tax=Aetokthonos hydrillicola Thurmond2011 TaxID=2712845 RepID=A0AAP5IBJ3_9CYAN|nr:P-loop NTPase family protein [Aetokthonos hydrillicola]MBO3461613.1 P-loop NTPase family protein [Aetokthonos hydrillicola CCALA 1050]MBW4589314.1 P-loop NTPase family protein [Aetokthonos hydrillicola CCALA 1050]MDR9898154.1 P-loop NTPase family protein [Aetokthonos hydrillicola Thurmond2011]
MVAQLETPGVNSTVSLSRSVKGLLQIFTSSYRNFFTSVMAQALRIAGQGTPVLVVQFLKGGIRQGYEHPIQLAQKLDWIRCNMPRCIDTPHLDDTEHEALQKLWHYTQKVILEDKYSLVVLDDLSLAIHFGLISETEVLEFLANRPNHIDIILTGSEMPKSILDLADQVTEIRRSHEP